MPKPITRMVLVSGPPVGVLSMFNAALLLVDRKEIKTRVVVFVRTAIPWDSSLICYKCLCSWATLQCVGTGQPKIGQRVLPSPKGVESMCTKAWVMVIPIIHER